MTKTFKKVGDEVYMYDSENPMVARRISGTSYINAPSNAIQVGPNLYNTSENIQLLMEAQAYFAKQEEEQKKQEQIEAGKSQVQRQAEAQAQVTSVPHVTSPEHHTYLESQEKQEKEKKIAQKIDSKIAPIIVKDAMGIITEKVKEEEKQIPYHSEKHLFTGSQVLFDSQNRKVIWDPNSRTFVPVEKANEIAQNIAGTFAPPIVKDAMGEIMNEAKDDIFFERFQTKTNQAIQTQQPVQTKIATPISPEPQKIQVAFAGGIASIIARVGSALWDFVKQNPKTIGTTISTTALSNAITQTAKTEEEKNQILWEIGQQNPQLVSEIGKEIARTKTNPIASIADMEKYAVLGIVGIIILYLLSKKEFIYI